MAWDSTLYNHALRRPTGGTLMDSSTVILGIEIPSTDPVFLGVIAIHIPLGLACVIAGAIAMLSAKGRGRHSIVGRIYYWCLGALFVSATLLAVMRWAEDSHLFVFGALAFSSAWLGHRAIQKRWPYWTGYTLRGWVSHTRGCWWLSTWTMGRNCQSGKIFLISRIGFCRLLSGCL